MPTPEVIERVLAALSSDRDIYQELSDRTHALRSENAAPPPPVLVTKTPPDPPVNP